MPVKIIIDSTVDVSAAAKERIAAVVPLNIYFGDEEFLDGVTITSKDFYEKLASGDVLPTTSQPAPTSFEEIYHQVTADGSEAVVITIASQLSGTYQSATIAADDFSGKILVVDSRSVTIGAGVLAEYALELAEQGMTAQQILEELIAARKKICLFAAVDTLEYLKRGGRLNSTVAAVGGLLNIKPILAISEGQIHVQSMARGIKKAFASLTELSETSGVDFERPIMLGHSGSDVNLQKYRGTTELWSEDTPSTMVGATIGTHAGPGAIAVAFFRK